MRFMILVKAEEVRNLVTFKVVGGNETELTVRNTTGRWVK
jgi:hypothetical protein